MSKLYISEFGGTAGGGSNNAQVVQEPCIVDQTPVDFGSGVNSSAVFNYNTRLIRVHTDAICSIAIGPTPTATINSKRMVAGQTEYFAVRPGDKLSVISNT